MESTERNLKPFLDLSNPLYKEVFFLVAQFLSGTPCQRAAKALIEELEAHELIPQRVNWLGEASPQDFNSFSSQFDHVGPHHLPKLLELCVKAANAKCPTSISIDKSLLSSSTLSFLSRASGSAGSSSSHSWSRKHGQLSSYRPVLERRAINPVHGLIDQSLNGSRSRLDHSVFQPDFFSRLQLSCSTLGHLSAVYCVLFDVSGRYVFTGADDNLVKIWSVHDGRLLATLRGASSEITDLAVNNENTMLAAGSCDKLIRVWCLRTCAPLAVLNPHSGSVTSLFFCPLPRSRHSVGYLASTSTDGSCSFWGFTENAVTGRPEFHANPTLYQERMRPGNAQMICSSFSTGGVYMAAGSADNNVRVYNMLGPEGPERILEVEVHSDRVDSISWAHEGLRFISGSKDGTALVWRFENAEWRYVRLYCQKVPGSNVVIQEDPKRRPRVTMVAWNFDDTLVLTAVSDNLVKVWNPRSGELVRVLKAHQDEAYVIESHPFNPRLICTAGHDGRIIIWDIGSLNKEEEGKIIFQHHNQLDQGQGHGAVFDCKWAPDGLSLAATDSHGHILLFTTQSQENSKFKKLPKELFFHTDYRPLTRDAITHEVLDEQTQVPPHLMPPPFLVDMEGNPYPPNLQRLVPGREKCRDELLVPMVAIGNGGYQEVIEGLPSNPRSNIDEMIEQLAIEQGVRGENQRNAVPVPRLSGGPSDNNRERRTVGLIRSGDVEGVRQSTGNWQRGNYGYPERKVIMPLTSGVYAKSEEIRMGHAELEESLFREHSTRRPTSGGSAHPQASPVDGISLREARARRVRRLPLEAAERRRQAESHSNILEIEGIARPTPRPEFERTVNQQVQRAPPRVNNRLAVPVMNPSRRAQGRTRYRYNVRRMFAERGAHNESDIENMEIPSEEDTSDEEVSISNSSSSSDSDSESDWGGGTRDNESRARRNQDQATGSRKSARKSNAASPQSEETNQNSDDDEPRPGPSSAAASSSASTASPIKSEPKSKGKKGRSKTQDFESGLEEIPHPFRPSEWLAEVCPKRTPYFPQIGDELVYYRQGHEQYVRFVEKNNMYEMTKKFKKTLPYVAHPDLEAAVPCRVGSMRFELRPPRLVILKLQVIDWETGELTGTNLIVQYHDVVNVVDFLIIRQIHDKYVRHNWNPGDRFRCLIDRQWWVGTVERFQPHDRKFPESKFLCYSITWDSGDIEKLSPWDMDIITDSFVQNDLNEAAEATEEEMRSGLYEANRTDWPPHGHQDAQCTKLSRLFEQVMGLAISEAFLTPVDINRYPNYAMTIEYPMDLSTIKARLDNRFYRRRDALKFDVMCIASNAEKFNRPDSDIVKHAKIIRDLCLELTMNPDTTDVNPVYHTIVENYLNRKDAQQKTKSTPANGNLPSTSRAVRSGSSTTFSSTASTSQQPTSSRRSLRNQGRHDRTSDEEVDDRPWKERCRDLLEKIWQCKDAIPFRVPVNPEEYPDYYQAIDTPMDLQSVREDLLGGNYTSPLDFHKDMNLIFNNSRHYNTDKRSQIYSMTIRLQSMYECQVKPILTSYRSRKKGKATTASPSKVQQKRVMPSRASSNTPRKNPKRNAASKNPYLQYQENGSGESEEENGDRRYSTRASGNHESEPGPSRRTTRNAASSSANRSVNGHSSRNGFSPPTTTQRRKVKRFRISSGESRDDVGARSNGQRSQKRPTRGQNQLSTRRGYAENNGSDSDEFESSSPEDPQMPQLHQPGSDYVESDQDYVDSDQEATRSSLRRSTRVQKKSYYDSDSDERPYSFRGRQARNYDETQNGSSGDEGNSRRPKPNKRRRRLTSQSRSEDSPPRKLRRQHTPKKKEDGENETEEEDDDDEADEAPGCSKRLLPAVATRRSTRRSTNEVVDEEEQDDEDDDEDEEVDDEEEEMSSEEEEEERSSRRSGRVRKKPSAYSDEDSSPRSRRSTDDRGGSRRSTRSKVDYAEDTHSDSEPEVSVSSRGRVRRKKSFLG